MLVPAAQGYIPSEKIAKHLPLAAGDTLYVISDILGIAKVCRENGEAFDAAAFIRSLQAAVGQEGTLLFPTFNWDFCSGLPFDYRHTKGKTGALGNAALSMPAFTRTQHPLYSFAVCGKHRQALAALTNRSAFGADSPFAAMLSYGAKALVIGLTPSIGNSFVHYVEQCVGVDYRYEKDFTGDYIDMRGNTSVRTYSMYVRDLALDPQPTQFLALDAMLSQRGMVESRVLQGIPYHLVDLSGLYEVVRLELVDNHARNLYTFSGIRKEV